MTPRTEALTKKTFAALISYTKIGPLRTVAVRSPTRMNSLRSSSLETSASSFVSSSSALAGLPISFSFAFAFGFSFHFSFAFLAAFDCIHIHTCLSTTGNLVCCCLSSSSGEPCPALVLFHVEHVIPGIRTGKNVRRYILKRTTLIVRLKGSFVDSKGKGF